MQSIHTGTQTFCSSGGQQFQYRAKQQPAESWAWSTRASFRGRTCATQTTVQHLCTCTGRRSGIAHNRRCTSKARKRQNKTNMEKGSTVDPLLCRPVCLGCCQSGHVVWLHTHSTKIAQYVPQYGGDREARCRLTQPDRKLRKSIPLKPLNKTQAYQIR